MIRQLQLDVDNIDLKLRVTFDFGAHLQDCTSTSSAPVQYGARKALTDDERAAIRTLHGNSVPLETIADMLKLSVATCQGVVRFVAGEPQPKHLLPHVSELFGAPAAASGQRFGYEWTARTVGHVAVMVGWSRRGIQSLVVSRANTSSSIQTQFATTKTASWFILVKDEYFTEIHARESESRDRITAICFHTNLRCSQWYGSVRGEVRTLTAPPGFYLNSIHGSNKDGACINVGANFVPLTLWKPETSSVWVANSTIIGDVKYDGASPEKFRSAFGNVGAIVLNFEPHLKQIRLCVRHLYQRWLAVTASPLEEGVSMLVLVDGELITALRACIADAFISAIQFDTTLRTTEWFGSVPSTGAKIETRHICDFPTATHIGGMFGMIQDGRIKSIGVKFYKN